MPYLGEDWDRFSSRHLGEWHGKSLALSAKDGSLIKARNYILQSNEPSLSRTNPSSVILPCTIWDTGNEDDIQQNPQKEELSIRYNLEKLHCFAEGSYSADHSILDLSFFLSPSHGVIQAAIEFSLPISATERTRSFLLYNKDRVLTTILLLEEARSGLYDTREPLALSSLVGEWKGQSETFRHEDEERQTIGFGTKPASKSPTRRARRDYSEDDLPAELKNPSGSNDGLLRTKTLVLFGWDPTEGTVRRSTVLWDMQDHELGRSVVYGNVESHESSLFDLVRFENNTESESTMMVLTNGCFVMGPNRRARGVSTFGELGCLITPAFRRRLVRMYGKQSVSSETLTSESLS